MSDDAAAFIVLGLWSLMWAAIGWALCLVTERALERRRRARRRG